MINNFKFKKIAYIIYLNDGPDSGVFKKIIDTLRMWIEFKIIPHLFILTSNAKVFEETPKFQDFKITILAFAGYLNRYTQFHKLTNQVFKFNPDLVYFRYQSYSIDYTRLASSFPIFVEINSDEITERRSTNLISHYYNLATRGLILKKASGFVFVTAELTRRKTFYKFNKPTLILANGINLKRIKELPHTHNKYPQLAFLGTPGQPWHGIDKIVKLAKLFPNWIIHIIGPDKSEFKEIPENLNIYGFLPHNDYLKIYNSIDVGIGTLALHRKGMNETSALKILEYLAHGIPVILGYKDTSFPKNRRFILKLPNVEDNIIPFKKRIEIFVNYWRNKRVRQSDISSIDSNKIEQKRLRFFENNLYLQ